MIDNVLVLISKVHPHSHQGGFGFSTVRCPGILRSEGMSRAALRLKSDADVT